MSMSAILNDTGSVQLGNVQTVPGTLRLAQAVAVKQGTLLARGSNEEFVPFEPGESGPPIAVMLYGMQAGPGAIPIDAMVSGKVNRSRLVIHSGGPITEQVADQLRATGLLAVPVQQLAQPDNGAA